MTAKIRPEPDDTRAPGVHDPGMPRLNPNVVDSAIIAVYFLVAPDTPNSTSTADVR
jgi:hypothetical protein